MSNAVARSLLALALSSLAIAGCEAPPQAMEMDAATPDGAAPDVDGSVEPLPCGNGVCEEDESPSSCSADCVEGTNEVNSHCFDGRASGDETGTDCGGSCVVPCPYRIAPSHPRIWLTAERKSALQEAIGAGDPRWDAIVAACDSRPAETADCDDPQWGGDDTLRFALCYQLTGDATYATKAYDGVIAYERCGLYTASDDSGYACRFPVASIATAYDWIYDQLDSGQRAPMSAALTSWGNHCLQEPYGIVGTPFVGNYFWGAMVGGTYAALATLGDTTDSFSMMSRARQLFDETALPYFNGTAGAGGGLNESVQYDRLTFLNAARWFEAIDSATGENLFETTDFFADSVVYFLHSLVPGGSEVPPFGDVGIDGGTVPPYDGWFMIPAARLAGTAESAYASYALENVAVPVADGHHDMARFIFGVADLPATDYRTELPTDHWALGNGNLFARSSWADDATFVTFQCGGPYEHNHYDEGSLNIYRNGWLTFEIAEYSRPGSASSFCHNTLVVNDVSQGGWSVGSCRNRRTSGDADYLFAGAELEDIYNSQPGRYPVRNDLVQRYTREWFFVRPDYIIVHDFVDHSRSSDSAYVGWHFLSEPSVTGSLTASGADIGYHDTNGQPFEGPATPWQSFDGREAQVVGAGARLEIRALWPADATLRKVDADALLSIKTDHPWRLDVMAPVGVAERDFITLLAPLPLGDSRTIDSTPLSGPGYAGASIDDTVGNRLIVLFGSGTSLSYSVPEAGATEHFVAGFAAGATVNIALGGDSPFTVTATEAGVLRFASDGAAGLSVSLTP